MTAGAIDGCFFMFETLWAAAGGRGRVRAGLYMSAAFEFWRFRLTF